MTKKVIKIGIVDDDLLLVQLLSDFFNGLENIEVCHTATSGNACLRNLENSECVPDVLIIDLRMKDGNGIELLKALQQDWKAIKTVVLSSFYDGTSIGQMFKLNASSFLPKEIDRETLYSVLVTVATKGYYFTPEQMETLRSQISSKAPKVNLSSVETISEREKEVLELLCQQYTTQQMADKLFLSPKTIESHKANLMVKTGAKNASGLIIYAIQNGIVDPYTLFFSF